jgi:hypothetical protein
MSCALAGHGKLGEVISSETRPCTPAHKLTAVPAGSDGVNAPESMQALTASTSWVKALRP